MSECDTKTAQKDTSLGILLLYFTKHPIVITLAINWVEKRNDYWYFKKMRQCATSFKIKCDNLES